MLRHVQRRLATAERLRVGALDKAGSNKSYLVRNYFYCDLFSAKPIEVIGMSYKQKWTRFTLAFIVLAATAAWGLVWVLSWLYSNITITLGCVMDPTTFIITLLLFMVATGGSEKQVYRKR